MKYLRRLFYRTLAKINFLGQKEKWLLRSRYKNKILDITIDIASSCNAKCPFCPRQVDDSYCMPGGIMKEEVFDTIFKQIKDMKDLNEVSLYAFGEPFLNKNAGRFIKKLKSINKKIILSTNTTNLEKNIDAIMDVDILQISIEGWDKESYEKYRAGLNFEETIARLQLLDAKIKERKEQGLKTPCRVIGLLLTKKTDLLKFINLWSPYTDFIKITLMYPVLGWDDEQKITTTVYNQDLIDDYFILNNRKQATYCSYAFNKLTLNSDGKAVLCCSDFYQKLEIGDYKNLKKAFNSQTLKQLRQKFLNKEKNLCDGCIYNYQVNHQEVFNHFPELGNIEELSKQKGIKIIYDCF